MHRQWYLIDDDGIHPIDVGDDVEDFWKKFDGDGQDAPWPEFNQTAVDASPEEAVRALRKTASKLGLELTDVSDSPALWSDGLTVGQAGELTVLGEPGVDIDDRWMALEWSEALASELGCDGAFFGYEQAAKTLHLTVFSEGSVDFSWCDSLLPGPSYAMVFDGDGRCTDEDPRRFALRKLEMPETSPLLDRYRFVLVELHRLGLEKVRPGLDDVPVATVLQVRPMQQVGAGESR